MNVRQGDESTNSGHAEDELALRELLIRVLEKPLQPLTAGMDLLAGLPKQIGEVQNQLKVVGSTVNCLTKKTGDLVEEIESARSILDRSVIDISGKVDSLIASLAEGRKELDAMSVHLQTLATEFSASAAFLAKMETALVTALDASMGRISAQMARKTMVLNILVAACLVGVIALSARVFLWPLTR